MPAKTTEQEAAAEKLAAERAAWDAAHGLKPGEYEKLSEEEKLKLNGEMPPPTEPPPVEEPKVVVDPKKRATHPPVTASPGQACQVEGCGYIFGDPVFGTEPHPTELVTIKPLPKVEPPRPVPPPRPESTAKCEPVVGAMNTCPTCGWNAKDSLEPHPVTP